MVHLVKAAKGNINTRHGERIGRANPHIGIDIGWGEGNELYAPADGYMTWATVSTYGRRAIITHSDKTYSLIAHAEAWFVDEAYVSQGQHIGTMGRTGGPWGAAGWYVHCHQEYRLANGTAVDPLAYMGSAPAAGGLSPLPSPPVELSEEDDMKPLYVTDSCDGNGIPGWVLLNARTGKLVILRNTGQASEQAQANVWGAVWGSAKRIDRNAMLTALDAITKTL